MFSKTSRLFAEIIFTERFVVVVIIQIGIVVVIARFRDQIVPEIPAVIYAGNITERVEILADFQDISRIVRTLEILLTVIDNGNKFLRFFRIHIVNQSGILVQRLDIGTFHILSEPLVLEFCIVDFISQVIWKRCVKSCRRAHKLCTCTRKKHTVLVAIFISQCYGILTMPVVICGHMLPVEKLADRMIFVHIHLAVRCVFAFAGVKQFLCDCNIIGFFDFCLGNGSPEIHFVIES